MSFVNENDLETALRVLFERGLNTIDTSALVYFFALSKILIEDNVKSITLDNGTEGRDKFIENVKDLIEIDDIHIWHPLKVAGQEANWNKNKSVAAFVSSNLLTTAYSRKEAAHPKKSPILSFKDGKASLHSEYLESVTEIISKYDHEVLRSICIWLLRKYKFESDISNIKEVAEKVHDVYGFQFDLGDDQKGFTINTSSDEIASLNILFEFIKINKSNEKRKVVGRYKVSSLSVLYKPFLILAGISGTGKTRFVREQAKMRGSLADTYCLTPVRPDWHEPSDLLGYISRLNGDAEYIATDVLKFIAKAWRAKVDAGLYLGVNNTDKEQHGYLIASGAASDLNAIPPYWLCLDEMNLAPVEQYFADYLSILETREWCWEGEDFKYFSDPLLTAGTLQQLGKPELDKLRKDLGFKDEGEVKAEDELWGLICEYGMGIPFNLIVAGTVNMDETTHGFSRKVIDRALSFDFGEFFPNNYDEFFESNSRNKRLSYPIWSQARKDDLDFEVESKSGVKLHAGNETIKFLKNINLILKNTSFELAYRALNELLLAVISTNPQDELTLKAVWDDFMMCKVLPRIEGDSDKLTTAEGEELLVELRKVLAVQLAPIWDADENNDQTHQRPDLYRENAVAENAAEDEKLLHIACRSKGKLKWMDKRLGSAMFTSFWP